MKEKDLKIKAADGYVLSARLREPLENPKGFIQINSGTGIPQRFYSPLAIYLTNKGYVTITFDYRGIGESKPETLRGFKATNFDWGELDMTAVLDWAIEHYPDAEKIMIGHSMGGQLIGVMKNADKVDRSILIASGTGYWKNMPKGRIRMLMPLLWYFYIPFTTTFCGYGGAKKIKQGENLPKGVALQWRRWCISKNYWERDFNEDTNLKSFEKLNGDMKSISFTDDEMISEKATNHLLKYYTKVKLQNTRISPSDVDQEHIGHFGFFSRRSKKLWELIA